MKFNDFQARMHSALQSQPNALLEPPDLENPEQLPALVLAYIGDAVFSLYARTVMLSVELNRVQVLHTLLARMASAPLQARALKELEASLTDEERLVVRRGRNTRSRSPRNTSIMEYRSSTALEALLGYLYLSNQEDRLQQILARIVACIRCAMAAEAEGGANGER